MQKYSTPAIVPGGGRDALSVETQADAVFGSVDVYLASDVHARIDDATARIGRQEARIMYLERRLFECESAMLMAHDAGRTKYMNEYQEPLEAPSPY